MTARPDPRGVLQAWDDAAFRHVATWHTPLLDRTMPALTEAASYSRLWFGSALVLAVRPGRPRRAALHGLMAIGLASLTANLVGKVVFPRDRPYAHRVPVKRRARHRPTSSSFPSGHSASAAAFTTGVALESPALAVPIGLLASAVCLSRVYTGVHYPSDVIAGIALGVTGGFAAKPLVRAAERHLSLNKVIKTPSSPPEAA